MRYIIIQTILFLLLGATKANAQYIEFGEVNIMPNDLVVEVPLVASSEFTFTGVQIGFYISDNPNVFLSTSTPGQLGPISFESYSSDEAAILWFEGGGNEITVQEGQILAYIVVEISPSDNGCFQITSGIDQIDNIIYLSSNGTLVEEEFEVESKEYCSFDPLSIEITSTDNTCFGDLTGNASLEITGGLSPYTIVWTNITGEQIATDITVLENLPNGSYQVTVSDTFQNEIIIEFEITSPSPIIFTSSFSDSICNNNNIGFITIETTQNLEYTWSDGTNNNGISNLSSGEYLLTVTNSAGCDTTTAFSIINYEGPNLSFTTKNTCSNEFNGEISFSDLSLGYQWSDNEIGGERDNLEFGTYSVKVTDQNQCEFIVSEIDIDTFTRIVPEVKVSHPLCFGDTTGRVIVDSLEILSIQWGFNDSNLFSLDSLLADNYSFRYTDSNECSFDFTFDIISPENLTSQFSLDSATCYSCEDGAIFFNIEGGIAPYDVFVYDSLVNTYINDELLPGSYNYTITDDNECSIDSFFSIDLLTLDITAFKPISVITPLSADKNSTLIFDGLENHPDNILSIYNRWGNTVFKASNYQSFNTRLFDGMYEGNPLPEGKYFYRLEVKSFDKPLSNTLTIIR